MNLLKIKLSIIFISLFSIVGMAQDVIFTTSTNGIKKVGLSDRFYVTYTANKSGNFIAPSFKNFDVKSGVSQGSSSNVSIVNGKMTQSMKYTFQLILQPCLITQK